MKMMIKTFPKFNSITFVDNCRILYITTLKNLNSFLQENATENIPAFWFVSLVKTKTHFLLLVLTFILADVNHIPVKSPDLPWPAYCPMFSYVALLCGGGSGNIAHGESVNFSMQEFLKENSIKVHSTGDAFRLRLSLIKR